MTTTIVFDVNETLLDPAAMDPIFERHFGDASVRREWVAQVLMTTLTMTLVGDYTNLGKVGEAALAMVSERRGVSRSDNQRTDIMREMRRLPPHPDVPAGLRTLRDKGFRLATLTNSPPAMIEEQLQYAGLTGLFDALLSVDEIRKFKPDPVAYEMAATALGASPADLWLVAAHNWDTTGALAAGWRAAFIARQGMVIGPLDRQPTLRGTTLLEVADSIIAADEQSS